ncbi:VOC family protein [Sphingomonas sp. 1P08PE]|uniref:VOC family protein n=1 Tax=Sphingomonas sp. 1P08PE TaxID=554122 RepID=UPI0039A0DF86
MISHAVLGANDLDASRAFYDAALGALGVPPGTPDAKGRIVYSHDGGRFLLTRPIDGQTATHGNGSTLGFLADSPEAADAWHAAGLAHGGTPCEDPPGVREMPVGRLYLAYLRDPAGNKICARHLLPA